MVRKNDLKRRFIKRLNDIEEQTQNIKKMVACGYLESTSLPAELEETCLKLWLDCFDEVKKIMDSVDRTMFNYQKYSENYPLEEEAPF